MAQAENGQNNCVLSKIEDPRLCLRESGIRCGLRHRGAVTSDRTPVPNSTLYRLVRQRRDEDGTVVPGVRTPGPRDLGHVTTHTHIGHVERLAHDGHGAEVVRARVCEPVRIAAVAVRPITVVVDDGVELQRVPLHEKERPAHRHARSLGVARSHPTRIGRGVRVHGAIREPDLVALEGVRRDQRGAHLVHRLAVTVLIRSVIVRIGRVRVDAGIAVVAVGVVQNHRAADARRRGHRVLISVAVPVGVRVHGALHAVVHHAVAVLVVPVAHLGAARVIGGVRIVAIRAVGHVPAGKRARGVSHGEVAVRVRVDIAVVRRLHAVIHGAVTVVIHHVAGLGRAGVHRRDRVVAVRGRGARARGLIAHRRQGRAAVHVHVNVRVVHDLARCRAVRVVRAPVTILVDAPAVADLRGDRVDGRVGVVAVRGRGARARGLIAHRRQGRTAVHVDIDVRVVHDLARCRAVRVVREAVAVLVHAPGVADLRGGRVDSRVGVVAVVGRSRVERIGRAPHTRVGLKGPERAVTVVIRVERDGIEPVRIFGRGKIGEVNLIQFHEVSVDVHEAAAVVVDTVADLLHARVDLDVGGLDVVAVGASGDAIADAVVAVAVTVRVGHAR